MFSFLFQSDTLSDMSLLTSPHRSNHTALLRLSTRAHEPSAAHAKVLDHHTTSTTICIPAFSLDNVTAGLLVHDKNIQKCWPLSSRRALHLSRFIRFENDGALIEVRDLPGGVSELVYTISRSSRRKTVACLSVEGVKDSDMKNLEERLIKGLSSLTKVEYCRRCVVCGTEAGGVCRCVVRGSVGRHLLDFSSNARNAAVFVGDWSGGAGLELFREGVQALCVGLECEEKGVVEMGVGGRDEVSALVQRAIRDRLGCYRTPPGRGVRVEGGSEECERMAEMLARGGTDKLGVDGGIGKGGRREKNRMAAARSNLKRKWRNKSLRLGVVILRDRISELREVEGMLRNEQMWLRQRCRAELGLPGEDVDTSSGMDMGHGMGMGGGSVGGDDSEISSCKV